MRTSLRIQRFRGTDAVPPARRQQVLARLVVRFAEKGLLTQVAPLRHTNRHRPRETHHAPRLGRVRAIQAPAHLRQASSLS
jgi:hypothetical protein